MDPITVASVGRNDPCPCGSRKKFKKCCLPKHLVDSTPRAEEESDVAPPRPPVTPSRSKLPKDPEQPLPERDWLDETFDQLSEVPPSRAGELVRAAIEDGRPLSGEDLGELLVQVGSRLQSAGMAAEFDAILDLADARHPQAAAEEAAWIADYRVENALLLDRSDLGPRCLVLAKHGADHIDSVFTTFEWIGFAGKTAELWGCLSSMWPRVRGSGDILPWAKAEFAASAAIARIALALAEGEVGIGDPLLRSDLKLFAFKKMVPLDLALEIAARLAGRSSYDPGAPRDDRMPAEAWLTWDFTGHLASKHGWPLTRADLARCDMLKMLLSGPGDKPQGRRRSSKDGRFSGPLLPPAEVVDEYLAGIGGVFFAHPHRVAALLGALGPWSLFLVERGFADCRRAAEWRKNLRQRCSQAPNLLDRQSTDPALPAHAREVLAGLEA